MASRLILRIQDKQPRLTGSERKLAEVLLSDERLVETHTATELARMAGVSKATTARFFRTLGYADFEEVRLQAREERNRRQPYATTGTRPAGAAMGRSIAEHLDLEVANLTRTFEELRSDRLPEIAATIAAAPQVWFAGFGAEEGVARTGRALFSRMRGGVHQLSPAGQDWAVQLAATGPRDALVLLTFPPRPRALPALVAYARTSRMRVLTVTDHAFQPQAERFSDIVLPCHVSSYALLPTHATMLSVLRLIAVAFLARAPDAVGRRLETLEAIEEELNLLE